MTGEMIRFADMDGDGNADFMVIAVDGSIRMWKNRGIIGTKGSSLYFVDLDGNSSLGLVRRAARSCSQISLVMARPNILFNTIVAPRSAYRNTGNTADAASQRTRGSTTSSMNLGVLDVSFFLPLLFL
jgi:hypothetical protein